MSTSETIETPYAVPGVTVQRVVTSGTFSLDGGTWDVDNNVWVIGDAGSCVVIDAAHDAAAILEAIDGRTVTAYICTHGHDDHINQVTALKEAMPGPALLHPEDLPLWDMTIPWRPDGELADGDRFTIGGATLVILHTPGHAPGACSVYSPELGVVFSGDTLFNGGPGATGRSFSDFPTIIESIRAKLLGLPPETLVLTGHGDSTTIGAEAPQLAEWMARGH